MEITSKIPEIESILGYTFKDKNLLVVAFTHSSYTNEYHIENNEKLEFLGDSVLNFIVAELLYLSAVKDEGTMTIFRASIVSRDTLAAAVHRLGLLKYLMTGVGLQKSRNWSVKFRSNLFESVLGAIYLDGGMENAKKFVYTHLGKDIAHLAIDYKSKLQEYKQAHFKTSELKYVTAECEDREFAAKVYIGDEFMGEGRGKKKKTAEREAAKQALKKLKLI